MPDDSVNSSRNKQYGTRPTDGWVQTRTLGQRERSFEKLSIVMKDNQCFNGLWKKGILVPGESFCPLLRVCT